MSVTVSAVPFLLIGALTGIMNGTIQGVAMSKATKTQRIHLENDFAQDIFNKEYQTQIVDKETLLKTLKEHGARNIEESEQNISCDCEQFHIEFTKINDTPYTMKISAYNGVGVDNLVKDIGDEYTANAQEVSYNKIKERLEEKNLEVEKEEILDDNTIVLTVNLD